MKTEITSNSLQELINKRAEKRAWDFISKLCTSIKESGLLEDSEFIVKSESYNSNIRSAFWSLDRNKKDSPLCILYDKKVKEFVIEETNYFVSKVESLVEQTDNLLNISENYNY